jgi:hypothetical protein
VFIEERFHDPYERLAAKKYLATISNVCTNKKNKKVYLNSNDGGGDG